MLVLKAFARYQDTLYEILMFLEIIRELELQWSHLDTPQNCLDIDDTTIYT